MMKVFVYILLLIPILTHAQTDSSVVYKQVYSVKGSNTAAINNYSKEFIHDNRNKFFLLSSFNKAHIDRSADTANYGYLIPASDTVMTRCLFIYIAGSIDVVRGDVVFIGRTNEAEVQLRNVRYTKYEMQNGKLTEIKEGNYKDLDMCKHCNVSGIKVAEIVDKGFVRISLAYHNYLKKMQKMSPH